MSPALVCWFGLVWLAIILPHPPGCWFYKCVHYAPTLSTQSVSHYVRISQSHFPIILRTDGELCSCFQSPALFFLEPSERRFAPSPGSCSTSSLRTLSGSRTVPRTDGGPMPDLGRSSYGCFPGAQLMASARPCGLVNKTSLIPAPPRVTLSLRCVYFASSFRAYIAARPRPGKCQEPPP